MLALALDTSTLQGVAGWVSATDHSNGVTVDGFAECSAPVAPGHAETLLERLETVLSYGNFELSDVDLLVFGRGPGTFTGLRIGLSTVKGIAVARDCPVIGISSLEALAFSACVEGRVATVLDARRSEFFGAIYDICIKDGLPVSKIVEDEWVGNQDSILEKIENRVGEEGIYFNGDGALSLGEPLQSRLGSKLKIMPRRNWSASAYWMARVGLVRYQANGPDDMDSSVPNYLREPDAKLPNTR